MSSSSVNYARLEGIQHKEVGAAVLFSILYIPFVPIFLYLNFRRYTFVWRSLIVFTAVRSAAFVLRAILSGSSTAGNDLNVVVTEAVLYGVGFFGLLYSAYTLALDRDLIVNPQKSQRSGPLAIVTSIIRNRMIIRLILLIAVIMAIVSGTQQGGSQSNQDTANTLRKASLYIFLVVSCLLLLVTIILGADEISAGVTHEVGASIGRRYGTFVIFTIAALCIVREAYLCSTAGNVPKQNRPQLFYPLSAATEYLAMLLFLVPGLVPTKQDLETRIDQNLGVQAHVYSPYPQAMALNPTTPQYAYRA